MRFPVSAIFTVALLLSPATLVVASDMSIAQPLLANTASNPLPLANAPQLDAQALPQDDSLSSGTASATPDDGSAAPAIAQADNDAPASLAALVSREDSHADMDDQARCLATAVFYEARSESLAGKLAVARVIINRTHSGRFPTSLCGVVTQPGQFSFVHGGQIPTVADSARQWPDCTAIARIALKDGWKSQAEGALFFHAARVSTSWGKQRLAQIDNHVFYR